MLDVARETKRRIKYHEFMAEDFFEAATLEEPKDPLWAEKLLSFALYHDELARAFREHDVVKVSFHVD